MNRRILAAVAAVLIASAGSLAVVTYARGADARALAGQSAVRVYVAAKQVPAGTTAAAAVKEGLMVQQLIARAAVPDDGLTAVDPTYGQLVATSTIQPGELVMTTRFAARGATTGNLPVPAGMLAVTVALDDPSHVGSFLAVGSKVAVFDTFNVFSPTSDSTGSGSTGSGGTKSGGTTTGSTPAGDHLQDRHEYSRATRLLLPSVEVLAVGATTTTAAVAPAEVQSSATIGSAAAQPTTTLFTLAVTQDEAERIIHSSRTGTLTFALLGPDAHATTGKGIDDRTLFEVTP